MKRKGAVAPLFAFLLPVMIILCGFAVNVAYMQLVRTELRVATDAAARAAGVAFSELQDVDQALNYAQSTAAMNAVAGAGLQVDTTDNTGDVEFGTSTKVANDSRYAFTQVSTTAVRSETALASAIRVTGRRDVGSNGGPVTLFFGGFFPQFMPVTSSVATQLDRDIALILDRSGSMAFHEDFTNDAASWDGLFDWVDDQQDYYMDNGGYWEWVSTGSSKKKKKKKKSGGSSGYYRFVWTDSDMEDAYYDMAQYEDELYDYYYDGGDTPDNSRWDALNLAVNAFLDVLDTTDQEEQVSLGSFSSTGELNYSLAKDFNSIRNWLDSTTPGGGTAIHDGLAQSFGSLFDGSLGRPYAAKTIVVMTDGQNNAGSQVILDQVGTIIATHNVIVHTVTFSPGADQTAMAAVAVAGGGKHYHADEAADLVTVFEEIANNLPTLITQ